MQPPNRLLSDPQASYHAVQIAEVDPSIKPYANRLRRILQALQSTTFLQAIVALVLGATTYTVCSPLQVITPTAVSLAAVLPVTGRPLPKSNPVPTSFAPKSRPLQPVRQRTQPVAAFFGLFGSAPPPPPPPQPPVAVVVTHPQEKMLNREHKKSGIAALGQVLKEKEINQVYLTADESRVLFQSWTGRTTVMKLAPGYAKYLKENLKKDRVKVVEGFPHSQHVAYASFMNMLDKGWIKNLRIDRVSMFETKLGTTHTVLIPQNDNVFWKKVDKAKINMTFARNQGYTDRFVNIVMTAFLWYFILNAIAIAANYIRGGGGGSSALGIPRDTEAGSMEHSTVKFSDVAGCDDVKMEVEELVTFLKDPDRYTRVGAKVPKGVLLVGPPGTGKTLLAKAIAHEAGVPFFYSSGSEFVEMFVGMGARRVRSLFSRAKKKAPSIIFIDEIDAIGKKRGAGSSFVSNDELDQTINQLLTAMDGFRDNSGIIVIGATNRVEVLDPALLRPGRFDRRVFVDLPSMTGRLEILKVHAQERPLATTVDLEQLARRTVGMSGADLANLLNEAAILAGRDKRKQIEGSDINAALERIIAGPEKKGRIISKERKELIAYHEAGHALMAALIPEHDALAKVSIMPRGQAGGLTYFTPGDDVDSGLVTKKYLEARMVVALGGRCAEEAVFGKENTTTGAAADLQEVTRLATGMVAQQGFSDKIGPITVTVGGGPYFGGADGSSLPISQETAKNVDDEIRKVVNTAYSRCQNLIRDNRNKLDEIAQLLIQKETVEGDEVLSLVGDTEGRGWGIILGRKDKTEKLEA